MQKTKINIFFQFLKQKNDIIIFDLSKYNFGLINKEILKKGNKNFILTDSNLLGVKEIERLINFYIKKWKINKVSLHIVENKYRSIYINKDLVSKILQIKNEIFVVKEDKKYTFLFDNFFKRNMLLKSKKIKKYLNEIIKIILNNKKI